MNKYFMTLPLIFFGLLSFTSPVLAAAITSLNFSVHIINPQLPARAPAHLGADKLVSYYRQLNANITSRNLIADAKQAIARGYIGVLFTEKPIISLYQERISLEKKLGNPYQGLDADMIKKLQLQLKVVQGAGRIRSSELKDYKGGLLNAEKVVDTYFQSAYRYAYYWNRTMAAYLKQQQASGQAGTSGTTTPADNTHHTTNGSTVTTSKTSPSRWWSQQVH